MRPGGRATLATKGASVASEASYPCLEFLDEEGNLFAIPVEFTVWYKVAGTGSPITIDTAGSDYDTVVAVYTGSPGAFTAVDLRRRPVLRAVRPEHGGLGDGPDSRRDDLWVQIGGLDETDGRTGVRSLPYGTLKVAVR